MPVADVVDVIVVVPPEHTVLPVSTRAVGFVPMVTTIGLMSEQAADVLVIFCSVPFM